MAPSYVRNWMLYENPIWPLRYESRLLGITLDSWQPQNQLLDAYVHLAESGAVEQSLHDAPAEWCDRARREFA